MAPPGMGWRWQKLRRRMLVGRPRCHWCGGVATTIDHVVPRALGGAMYDPANLVPACVPCNARRGAETRDELARGRSHSGPRVVRHGAIRP